jgi:hypothetical protein
MDISKIKKTYAIDADQALKQIADLASAKSYGIPIESIDFDNSVLVREARKLSFFLLQKPWDESSRKDRISYRGIAKLYGYNDKFCGNIQRYVKDLIDLETSNRNLATKQKLVEGKKIFIELYAQLIQTTQTKGLQNV